MLSSREKVVKSVPKKSIHGSSDIYLGTQWKQRHDSRWSYRSDVIVTFLCYGTIGIIWHRDHQSTAKKVLLTPGGGTRSGFKRGCVQLRGPNPYPILGIAGLRKHTLF